MPNSSSNKEYLGDSVYVQRLGWGIELTTENGMPSDPSNRIVLDPEVIAALVRYVERYGEIPKRTS